MFTTVERPEPDEHGAVLVAGPAADPLGDNASISGGGTWGRSSITDVTCGPSTESAPHDSLGGLALGCSPYH